ncbi:electron transfer flavoprotein subunit beta/FixA family protein [Thermovenabulum sp.]|uniref:electron transfer flavoprotein subunit beta/FixA family protein n=1 Tax=Thermovenabulum sp. TaxID=3100335 RepID=UPI003C79DB14
MKIVCLVKFIPDVENFAYDYKRNTLIRENVRLIINPDDTCALALALKLKEKNPGISIEVVSMAPLNVIPIMEDLIRRKIDRATLISDKLYAGSDTYVTSMIIARYLKNTRFDCIFTGTRSIDGDTAHVPSQIAEILGISNINHIIDLEDDSFNNESAIVKVDFEKSIGRYKIKLPAVLSFQKVSKYKLPYIKYEDLYLDAKDKITIVTNKDLGFDESEVGLKGSLTRVTKTFFKEFAKKKNIIVTTDDDGIETVYKYLRLKGFV